jgi:nitroreductase
MPRDVGIATNGSRGSCTGHRGHRTLRKGTEVEYSEVVQRRRSIRRFLPRAVPDEVIEDILQAAWLAPQSAVSQPCRFGVIKDGDVRSELAQAAAGQTWIGQAPVVLAYCVSIAKDFSTASPDNLPGTIGRDRYGTELIDYLGAYKDPRAMRIFWENSAPLLAGQQAYLAAVSHKLSACWVGHLDIARTGRILGLPKDMVCLYLMPLGYPAEEPGETWRRPLSALVFHDRWES